jgi:hypothetical protein
MIRKMLESGNVSLSGGMHHWLKRRSIRGKETCGGGGGGGDIHSSITPLELLKYMKF